MPEAHVLLVEDDEKLVDLLRRTLSETFAVSTYISFSELDATLNLSSIPYDVVVLDRMMDGKDTLTLIPDLKARFPQCKILVLSAISTPTEKAMALDLGADDYLSKPFDSEELAARIRAILRRVSNEVRFGNVCIDALERTVKVDNRDVPLSNKEFLLLRAFMQSPGKVFSKTFLYEQVWQMSADIESNAVETTVNKLRRKLEEAAATAHIRNSRNLGYWLEE